MKTIKYLVVDREYGLWEWNKEEDHPTIAVPKMLNHLDKRLSKLSDELIEKIEKNFSQYLTSKASYLIEEKFSDIQQELSLHSVILKEFNDKIIKFANGEGTNVSLSPMFKIKDISTPLLHSHKNSLGQIYEHWTNDQIFKSLEEMEVRIKNLSSDIDICKDSFKKITNLSQLDANLLITELREIRNNLDKIADERIFKAFFYFDDATRGLLRKNLNVKINLGEASNKIYDYIFRNLLKGINNYKNSAENESVNKAIEKIRDLGLNFGDINLKILLEIKTLLEIEPKNPSLSICYKKIGELHSNFHQKKFEFTAIKYLKKYFNIELIFLVDVVKDGFDKIYLEFTKNGNGNVEFRREISLSDRSLYELEIYSLILQELLMQAEVGKTYFFLNRKLHNIHQYITNKYNKLDEKKLYNFLDMLSSPQFYDFANSVGLLIMKLREELKYPSNLVFMETPTKTSTHNSPQHSPQYTKTSTHNSPQGSPQYTKTSTHGSPQGSPLYIKTSTHNSPQGSPLYIKPYQHSPQYTKISPNSSPQGSPKYAKSPQHNKYDNSFDVKKIQNRNIDTEDLVNVGIITGKTTMIDTYAKAIEEISAALGTFMANLKLLMKEMLQNLENIPIRQKLFKNYENIESIITDINRNSFNDSGETVSSNSNE